MGLKMSEILLILAALLLLFGASRLPQLGSSLGSAIRNFKKGFGGEGEEPVKVAEGDATGKLAGSSGTTTSESDKVASKQG
jgi:sec-independent protein translocase protein TatA